MVSTRSSLAPRRIARDVAPTEPPVPKISDPHLDGVRKFAKVFDTYLVDPILGFVLPGVGDIVGSTLGLYIVALAVRRGVPPIVIARMLMNLSLDAATGIVPVVGDLVDFGFKANLKNLELLERRSEPGSKGTWHDWAMVGGALVALVAVIAIVIYVIAWAVHRVGW